MESERPLTVLHLDAGRELRGGQWQVLRLLRGLRKRGHQNLLLAPANSPLLEYGKRERFQCASIGPGAVRSTGAAADLVHAHDARSHTMAVFLLKRPVVVSRRVAFPVKRGPLSRWKYSRPKCFAAVSETVADELRKAQVPEERIRVIYDGVPLLADKWSAKGPVVVPRFTDERKENELPLEAAREANLPIIRSTRLEADLEGASVLLYLTHSEGLGSAALLAMSAGIPVIASDIGGLREVVRNEENGLLVPNELQAVTGALRRLRDSPEELRRMSLNARQMVMDRFSEDRMVEETIALYEGVLRGPR